MISQKAVRGTIPERATIQELLPAGSIHQLHPASGQTEVPLCMGRGEPQNSLLDLVYAAHQLQSTLQGCAELAAFRAWFAEFDAEAWDRRIEDDVASGRLDGLADEALEDLQAGRCSDR